MQEEELCAGPEGVLLADGAASFLLSWLELADEVSGVAAGPVEVEDVCGVHDEDQPAEKLVNANACRSCTSCSAFQSRWNKRVILL